MAGYNTTWQQVSGANLSGPVDALVSALKGAGSTLNSTLQGVEDTRKAGAVGEMLQRSLNYTTPEQLESAMSSGALTSGINSQFVTPDFVKGIQSRISSARENELGKLNADINREQVNVAKLQQERLLQGMGTAKADSQKMFEYQQLVNKQDITALRQWEKDNQAWLSTQGANGAKYGDQGELAIKGQVADKVAGALATGFKTDPVGSTEAIGRLLNNQSPEEQLVTVAALKKANIPIEDPAFLDSMGKARELLSGAAASTGQPTAPVPAGQRPSSGAAWASAVGLTQNESGGKTNASNNAVGSGGKVGHFGLLQFGQDRLADAKAAGVLPKDMTPEQYRDSGAELQNRVADWHFDDIDKQASKAGLEKYYGQTIKGVVIDRDAIRGMAHLGGLNGVKTFLASNGEKDPADRNNTKLSDYGRKFSGGSAPVDVNQFRPTVVAQPNNATALVSQAAAPAFASNGGGAAFGMPNVARQNPNNTKPRAAEAIQQAAVAQPLQQPETFSTPAAAVTHDTSRIGQAFRDAGRSDALATFGKEGIAPYVEAMHKRSVRDDEEKTYENNVSFVNKNLPGDAKISQGELRTLYNKHTKGLSAQEKPDISVFSQMLIESRDSSIALPFTRQNMREDKILDSFGDSATRYSGQALESKVKAFTPGAVALRGELSKVVKEQVVDSQKADVDLKALRDSIPTLEKRVATAKQFNLPSGAMELQLVLARASLSEAEQKAKSKLNSAVGLTQ